MRLHRSPQDFRRRHVLILLGYAALYAIQHLHLLCFAGSQCEKGLGSRIAIERQLTPSLSIAWQDSQVRTPSEHRNAQTIFQHAANQRRWTVTGPRPGSACLFSAGLWARRWTTS